MYLPRNLLTLTILTLPFAWLIGFVSFHSFMILFNPIFIPLSVGMLLCGLFIGGFLADYIRQDIFLLIFIEFLILFYGIMQIAILPISSLNFFNLLFGIPFLFFCLGVGLVLMTIFLNQLVPAPQRGHVTGIVALLALVIGGTLSLLWRILAPWSNFVWGGFSILFFVGLLFVVFIRPWKRELKMYLVPGSILPYLVWWVIYLIAFGLYAWATPLELRILYSGVPIFDFSASPPYFSLFGRFPAELVLVAISGAAFVLTFLPDRIGRKRVFSVASVLLGELCIFAAARHDPSLGYPVSMILMVLEIFVIAFIIGVGAWLVWVEIGAVRYKGRRTALGWILIAVTGIGIWINTVAGFPAPSPFIVYPLAATLVLLGIFPLTTAVEVIWNERIVEDIDISVDSRQVSRALRELEDETQLQSIQEQIENQIGELTKIQGVTRQKAQILRKEGYETPALVARADTTTLAELLGISVISASKIKWNAEKIAATKQKTGIKSSGRKKKSSSKKK